MRKILSILAVSLCAAACIYPYDPDIQEAPEGVLSVDGNISIGDASTVRLGFLYSMKYFNSGNSEDLYSAHVWVEDDSGENYPGELYASASSAYGWYSNPSYLIHTENARADRRYRLCIEVLDATYVSDWTDVPAPPVIREIGFTADDENVTVTVSVDGGEDGTGYLLFSYDETWEFHADYIPSYEVDTRSWTISEGDPDYSHYWCWQYRTNDLIYPVDYTSMEQQGLTAYPLYSFPRQDNRNHRRYCANIHAKTLTPASYRFLKNIVSTTDGGDNLFTPNPGEIPSNIRCETHPERSVYGYALFSRSVSKRAFLDERYYIHTYPRGLIYPTSDYYPQYYGQGYLPLDKNPKSDYDPQFEGEYGWGARYCWDCTAAGGTQKRPDFWYEQE